MPVEIKVGDCVEVLKTMPDESVDCVVTSPPYWALRDYGVDGQLGLEATLGEHLDVMVAVFEEVKRVLKQDGTLWLNYGDCYATAPNGRSAADTKAAGNDDRTFRDKPFSTIQGHMKNKDLCMVPNRLALALQQPQHLGPIKKETDRAWLAGLIDADGCIGIRRESNGKWNPGYIPYVTVACSDRALVERCVEVTGLGNVNVKTKAGTVTTTGVKHRRDCLVWRLDGQIASKVIRDIYPYLIQKKRQAVVCNAMNVSQATARPTKSKPVPAATVAYRQSLYELIKALNQRQDVEFPNLPTPKPNVSAGWWVRSEIIWAKPNPMPESVTDRPACAHEKIWLLSKAPKYFYDNDGVRLAMQPSSLERLDQNIEGQTGSLRANGGAKSNGTMKAVGRKNKQRGHSRRHDGFNDRWDQMSKKEHQANGRNLRNYEPAPVEVWNFATSAFSEAHFATFPPELAERCIRAGCPVGGVVLDPFGGAGTTGLVADRMQRDAILIELNPEYAALAQKRIDADRGPLLDAMEKDDESKLPI